MTILIVGNNGQVGWELERQAAAAGLPFRGCDLPDIDITDPDSVNGFVTSGVELVVNAAAYTAVDQAESEPEAAFAVNADGPGILAAACAELGIPLIHISTDYVFDGSKVGAYEESDPVAPLGVYGNSKAEGEIAVRSRQKNHLILRTAWLCGVHGNNFVKTMLRLGQEKEEISVVGDQHGCPTFAFDLAEGILLLAKQVLSGRQLIWGTYHFCGKGATTWFGFAQQIFNEARAYIPLTLKNLKSIDTTAYPTPAERPKNSVLECRLIEKQLGIVMRPWQESLHEMMKRLLGPETG
jgi:dTDP-4-dehydrorhamnose reductase